MSTVSSIRANPAKARDARWYEYAVRFFFGGVITALVGVVGKAYGPVVAGLFLAFPAILPASLTLVAKNDGEKSSGVDAIGAALGSIGLMAFGIVIWVLSSRSAGWLALTLATVTWAAVSMVAWLAFNRIRRSR